jgi:hypothetical protein
MRFEEPDELIAWNSWNVSGFVGVRPLAEQIDGTRLAPRHVNS